MFPTREQELLLKAALKPAPEGLDAWREWNSRVGVAKVPPWETTVRQMAAMALANTGGILETTASGELGQLRKEMAAQAARVREFTKQVLEALAGLEVLALSAATEMYYEGAVCARPTSGIVLLVTPEALDGGVRALAKLGLTKSAASVHGVQLQSARGLVELRHNPWRVPRPGGTGFFRWRVRLETLGENANAYGLEPEMQLLYILESNMRTSTMPTLWWVADVVHQLRQVRMDWEGLVQLVRNYALKPHALECLKYVRKSGIAPELVPEEALAALDAVACKRSWVDAFWAGVAPPPVWAQLWLPTQNPDAPRRA